METDYQKMYNNLTMLLQDICQFLSSDKLGSLSHKDKKLVESLITRSKVQLQEIAKVEKISVSEEYVDMDAKKVPEEDEEKQEIYSSIDDINKNVETFIEAPLCPYTDLAAREASQEVKWGFLSMRRKFLLGFEKMKRIYGTIHNQWLLVYCSDKDSRPIFTFNLKNFEAKEADGIKNTNFELMSTSSDRKIYYFMALTPKDMLQWVVYINRCHDNVIVQSKGLDFGENDALSAEEDTDEHYDCVGVENNNLEMREEDDIYLELDAIVEPYQNNNTIPQKKPEEGPGFVPPLPGRPQKGVPIPVPSPIVKPSTPIQGSSESLPSYDAIQFPDEQTSKQNSDNTISDDEDTTYETFVQVKQKIAKKSFQIPISGKDGVNQVKSQLETTVTEVTKGPKKYVVSNIKGKIDKYQVTPINSNESTGASKTDTVKEGQNTSFVHKVNKKSNVTPSLSLDTNVKESVDETRDKKNSSPDPRTVKVAGGLSPPVIPKVPVVPTKPKLRDGPSIGKRPFGNFRQLSSDH